MPNERKGPGEELSRLLGLVSEAISAIDAKKIAEDVNAFLEREAKLSESLVRSIASAIEPLLSHADSAARAAAAAVVGNPNILRSGLADRWLAQLLPPALELLSDADGAVRSAVSVALDNVTRWTKDFPILDEKSMERVKAAADSVDGTIRSVAEAILGRLEATRSTTPRKKRDASTSPARKAPRSKPRAKKATKPAKSKPKKLKPKK